MALSPTRLEFRLQLSHVDRGLEREQALILARHPSETQDHAILRTLAWCLFWEEGLELGPGLSTPEAADLWTRDATGQLVTWIECGAASGERVRKVLQHNRVALHVLFDDPARAETLVEELPAGRLPRGAKPVAVWTVERAFVAALAEREDRRQKWAVTIVGDVFYVDADGRSHTGAATRRTIER